MHIYSVDLNLLVIAASLYRTKNVSKSAQELGLTQPAVSHALTRLREHFKDPLFVRTSKGVAPTEFARTVQEDILRIIQQAELLVNRKKSFDPKDAKGRITLATTDYFESTIMSALQPTLMKEAPSIQLSLRPTLGELPKRDLEDGKIDLAIAGFYQDLPEGFYQSKITTDTFACAIRKDHPFAKLKSIGMDEYFAEKHALITLQGDLRDSVTRKIGKLKQNREIIYGSYSFTGMAWVLSRSNFILTAPKRLLLAYESFFPIHIFACPVDLGEIELRMIWHAQTHSSPLHGWFRNQVKIASSTLMS